MCNFSFSRRLDPVAKGCVHSGINCNWWYWKSILKTCLLLSAGDEVLATPATKARTTGSEGTGITRYLLIPYNYPHDKPLQYLKDFSIVGLTWGTIGSNKINHIGEVLPVCNRTQLQLIYTKSCARLAKLLWICYIKSKLYFFFLFLAVGTLCCHASGIKHNLMKKFNA